MRFTLVLALMFLVSPCWADNFFSNLKKDQQVKLEKDGNGYTITIYKDFPLALQYKITYIGVDYIVVEDSIGEIRIPIYSIKSITTMKIPKVKE